MCLLDFLHNLFQVLQILTTRLNVMDCIYYENITSTEAPYTD